MKRWRLSTAPKNRLDRARIASVLSFTADGHKGTARMRLRTVSASNNSTLRGTRKENPLRAYRALPCRARREKAIRSGNQTNPSMS